MWFLCDGELAFFLSYQNIDKTENGTAIKHCNLTASHARKKILWCKRAHCTSVSLCSERLWRQNHSGIRWKVCSWSWQVGLVFRESQAFRPPTHATKHFNMNHIKPGLVHLPTRGSHCEFFLGLFNKSREVWKQRFNNSMHLRQWIKMNTVKYKYKFFIKV